MTRCPACAAELATPLVCTNCGALISPNRTPTPFEIFALEPGFAIDGDALRKELVRQSRRMHPDYFASQGPAQRELAERNTAELNAAFEILSDEVSRADWLVRALGGPDENLERAMPQEFLMEVLEWNEALDLARNAPSGSPARAALVELERSLGEQRRTTLELVRAALEPTPATNSPRLTEARRQLNALSYLDRALREIEALKLDQAASNA